MEDIHIFIGCCVGLMTILTAMHSLLTRRMMRLEDNMSNKLDNGISDKLDEVKTGVARVEKAVVEVDGKVATVTAELSGRIDSINSRCEERLRNYKARKAAGEE